MLFSGEVHLSCFQLFLVAYNMLYRTEASWAFPIHFGVSVFVDLVRLTFGQSRWWDFMGAVSDNTSSHDLTVNSMILWLLHEKMFTKQVNLNIGAILKIARYCSEYIHWSSCQQPKSFESKYTLFMNTYILYMHKFVCACVCLHNLGNYSNMALCPKP